MESSQLSFFPSPYPGEWWYSVLCRYHVRTGNSKHQTTLQNLCGGKTSSAIGALYPNSTIYHILSKLPEGLLDPSEVAENHTLFRYYSRFYSLNEKKDMLNRIIKGEMAVITSIRKFADMAHWHPQYCPCCAEADREVYGEAYWHMVHQIPIIKVCPMHGCYLHQVDTIPLTHTDYSFYPLDSLLQKMPEKEEANGPPWLLPLTKILSDYYSLPLEASVSTSHNNLAIALSNQGYGVIQGTSPYTILDAKKLYADMTDFYGLEFIKSIFGGKDPFCHINRMSKWLIKTPERYALLQCFAGVGAETVFAENQVPDLMEEKMKSLSSEKTLYTKKQVCEQLNITSSQLNILSKKFGIQPFWREIGVMESGRPHKVRCTLSDTDYASYKKAFLVSGYKYESDFLRHCIQTVIAGGGDNKS